MSIWTQVVGAIDIDTYDYYCVDKLEEFFGGQEPFFDSEGSPIQFFVNKLEGFNVYGRNENGGYEYQTRCVVSVVASLRDTTVEDVNKYLDNVIKEAQEKFGLRHYCIRLEDSYDEVVIRGVF